MLKDLKLAQAAAQSSGATTPLGAEAAQLYSLFSAKGHGGLDFSGIIRMLRENCDLPELKSPGVGFPSNNSGGVWGHDGIGEAATPGRGL